MKLKDGFITYEMGGEQVIVSTGSVRFPGLVRSNKTAAFIVDCLKTETTQEAIISAMLEKYDAPRDVIARDVAKVLDGLRSVGALEE